MTLKAVVLRCAWVICKNVNFAIYENDASYCEQLFGCAILVFEATNNFKLMSVNWVKLGVTKSYLSITSILHDLCKNTSVNVTIGYYEIFPMNTTLRQKIQWECKN